MGLVADQQQTCAGDASKISPRESFQRQGELSFAYWTFLGETVEKKKLGFPKGIVNTAYRRQTCFVVGIENERHERRRLGTSLCRREGFPKRFGTAWKTKMWRLDRSYQ